MESIAFYLLKSAAWLAGFTLVYLLFLRKERFFRLKRAYLVAGVVPSLLLPLITIHYTVELPAPIMQEAQVGTMAQAPETSSATVHHEQKSPLTLFLMIYAGGMVLFLFRALLHIFSLYRALSTGSVSRTGDAVMVKTEKYTSAFSFFNFVFINPSVSEQEARDTGREACQCMVLCPYLLLIILRRKISGIIPESNRTCKPKRLLFMIREG